MEKRPKVTVVIPVFNCRASLGRALDSVFEQSLGADAIEIIAVDDGSTDGSGAELDRLAAEHPRLTVLHQENSGGPGAPRNVGIEQATGEYVFFLDADDYFAPEALERLCAMADANDADVVVGQCVGVNRKPPVFQHDVAKTDLAESPFVYDTLSPLKLFRRSLLDKHKLRFLEGIPSHEDQLFTAKAYFHATAISVLASYDCYYWVDREDGTSSLQQGGAPAAAYFPVIGDVMSYVADQVEPGPLRDRLMWRHFRHEVVARFDKRYLTLPADERALTRDSARALVEAWYTDGVDARFGPRARLIAHCLRHGLDDVLDEVVPTWIDGGRPPTVVDGERAYMALPRFRDPSVGIPDACYEITGSLGVEGRLTGLAWRPSGLQVSGRATITGVTEDQEITLLLEDPETKARHRVPATATAGGFEAEIGFAPGAWDVHVEVKVQDLALSRRLIAYGEDVEEPSRRLVRGGLIAAPGLQGKWRSLTLEVTEGSAARLLRIDQVTWGEGSRLRVLGHVPSALPPGDPVQAGAEMIRRGGEQVHEGTADGVITPDRLEVTAEFDLHGCPPGIWDPWLEVAVAGVRLRARPPAHPALPDAASSGLLRRASPYATKRDVISVKIVETPAMVTARRLTRRLLRRS